eukprot:TRINITY_DN102124_c0_g1_i1.p2 TRINITY_DN102124_c0_g1~~TRINITY_DN102124_c0_g1_i1.p2  ORF type:complete len:203 (+),score=42.13 TRINITY_DN102124_c0_g1_i1:668-1276(+)
MFELWNKFLTKTRGGRKRSRSSSRSRSRTRRRDSRSPSRSRRRTERRRSRSSSPMRKPPKKPVRSSAAPMRRPSTPRTTTNRKKLTLPVQDDEEDGNEDEEEEEPDPDLEDDEDGKKFDVVAKGIKRATAVLRAIGVKGFPKKHNALLKRRPGWPKWCSVIAKEADIKWPVVNRVMKRNGISKVKIAKTEKILALMTIKDFK